MVPAAGKFAYVMEQCRYHGDVRVEPFSQSQAICNRSDMHGMFPEETLGTPVASFERIFGFLDDFADFIDQTGKTGFDCLNAIYFLHCHKRGIIPR